MLTITVAINYTDIYIFTLSSLSYKAFHFKDPDFFILVTEIPMKLVHANRNTHD